MTLTAERQALLRSRLAELEEAEFMLIAGVSAATVTYEGESVTFRQAAGGLHQVRDMMNRIRRELREPIQRQTSSRSFVLR